MPVIKFALPQPQSVKKLTQVIINLRTNIGKDLICEQNCNNNFEAWQHYL